MLSNFSTSLAASLTKSLILYFPDVCLQYVLSNSFLKFLDMFDLFDLLLLLKYEKFRYFGSNSLSLLNSTIETTNCPKNLP